MRPFYTKPNYYQECLISPEYDGDFEPRCRPWYQDAIQAGNTGAVFTNPYEDATTKRLIITSAAPVYGGPAGELLGVVGLDIDSEGLRAWISDLTVIEDQGYAYLLAPGGEGEMAFHKDLKELDADQDVFTLEEDTPAFRELVAEMSTECRGTEEYEMDGARWILAWKHETASGAGASGSDECGEGGFIAVVTVGEDVLLEVRARVAYSARENKSRCIHGISTLCRRNCVKRPGERRKKSEIAPALECLSRRG